MDVLNHLAQAAAVILLIELLVFLLLFLGIAGGLAFGLRWVRGKSGPAFEKANGYLERVPGYTEKASGIAASPIIKVHGVMRNVQVTAQSLRAAAQRRRSQQPTTTVPVVTVRPPQPDLEKTMEVAARPVPPPGDETEVIEPVSLT